MNRRILPAALALLGVGVPAALLVAVYVDRLELGALTLLALLAPPAVLLYAFAPRHSRLLVRALVILSLSAWSTVGYAGWRWSLYAAALRNLETIRAHGTALDAYREAHGAYPQRLDQTRELARPDGETFGADVWGHALYYQARGDAFILVSYGRGGVPEGRDYWADRESGGFVSTCGDPSADQVLSDRGFLRVCGK